MEQTYDFPSIVGRIQKEKDCDLYIYSADVDMTGALTLFKIIQERQVRRQNIGLIITTPGGDPDAAYRMVQFIKKFYKSIIFFVFGPCKSAGTLMALGADEIVMGLLGEFGPLDIQLSKDDEFIVNTSGLSYFRMLEVVNEAAFNSFEQNFLRIKQRSGYAITTKTAGEICSTIAAGLISPITAQIDPLKLGDIKRAMNITFAYGQRLGATHELLNTLINGYPTHGFVIDIAETARIFKDKDVRAANEDELWLSKYLEKYVTFEKEQDFINIIELDQATTPNEDTGNHTEASVNGKSDKSPERNGAVIKPNRGKSQIPV